VRSKADDIASLVERTTQKQKIRKKTKNKNWLVFPVGKEVKSTVAASNVESVAGAMIGLRVDVSWIKSESK